MKNMLNFKEFTADELMDILNLALDMKKNPEKYSESLKGKKLYTLFEKTSTRTFLSFATGITELGGTYYNQLWKDSNFVLGEPVSEIKYVCRNVDIIMARLIKNETVELFGKNATVPFINGCDNSYHPCQILADALTILEKFGTLDVNLMYIGAKNNVFNSHVEFFSKMKKVQAATGKMFDQNVSYIEMSPELSEIAANINQLKQEAESNARLAKENEQRKNDLIMYLAHDLKTPLSSVIGYLTLLRDESQISKELREKYLSITLGKAERLEDLINEFFEITRFNIYDITLQYTKINLTRLLEQLVYEFKPMLKSKNLQCNLCVDDDIMLRCDADKIQRVFDNLLRNAVIYSFENTDITISAQCQEDTVSIIFCNHGDTLPEEKLNRIFEQFYRLDAARSTSSGGAGLGLAIAKQIVELHNGTIVAESQEDQNKFSITLPLA